jgi:hypothetical protein|tara:strand:- start:10703 stop:11242 length:540 start_codon:yes stop_codon:yes gene_type:complete
LLKQLVARDNAHAATRLKFNHALGKSKKGVVLSKADTTTSVELRATLANKDFACLNELTAVALDTTKLWVRVATVSCGTTTFLMCHGSFLSVADFLHPKPSVSLTVSIAVTATFPPTEMLDIDFFIFLVTEDLSNDRSAIHLGSANDNRAVFLLEQAHMVKNMLRARLGRQSVNPQLLT